MMADPTKINYAASNDAKHRAARLTVGSVLPEVGEKGRFVVKDLTEKNT